MFSIMNIFAEYVVMYPMYLSWAIVSRDYGLMPAGNKSLPPLTLTKFCDAV